MRFRKIIKCLLRPLIGLLFRVRINDEHIAQQASAHKRLLVVANHESFLDGLLLGLYLPFDPVFVVHSYVPRKPFFRLILSLTDYLAIDPANPMAMKTIMRLIENGRPVVIFPEGRITTTGSLMKIYEGPAFIAARTGATLMPIRLDGGVHSYFSRVSTHMPKRLFPAITLTVMPFTTLAMPEAPSAKQRRRKAGETLRHMMQEMLFASRPQKNLIEALLDTAKLYGQGRRIVEDIKQIEYSYRDILKAALVLGRLLAKETQAKERIGLFLPNAMPTLALIFGLSAFNRISAMLNYTAGIDALSAAAETAQIKLVVSSRAFIEKARLENKLSAFGAQRIVYLEDLRASLSLKDKLWLIFYALPFTRRVVHRAEASEEAVVMFTSGSEGKPKGVVLSHRAILANVNQVRAIYDINSNDRFLNALPLFHSFGLTAGSVLPLIAGARLFLYPSPLHYRVIPEIAYDRNCTVIFGTSSFLGNYAKYAHPYDFYRMRYVVAGAEKLADTVRTQWMDQFGIRILEGYGATETAPIISVNTPMAYRKGSVGKVLPGMEARIVPVPGIEVGGMLHVRGPNLMTGYLKYGQTGKIEPPSSSLGEGWYETGDVVDIDPEGYIHILGRVKRFAKIAGEMVSLEVVEKIAQTANPLAQHACSTHGDSAKGEALVLFTTTLDLSKEMLQKAARSLGVTELAIPRKIIQVDALPLLGTGKIDYVTLKKQAEAIA